jgi:hypothetical protein
VDKNRCDDPNNALLPWYLNGTLEAAEEAQVRSHIASCPACARDLEHLSEIAEALQGREPDTGERRPTVRSAVRLGRLRWALVAVAILGAVLVARAIRTGTAPASDASTEDESSVVSLDLRSGPSRGAGTMPTLALAGAVGEVNLRLSAPINSTATYEMELRSPQGKVLTSSRKAPLTLDGLGRASYRVQAALLSPSGEYQLVLREFDASGAAREYAYPFRVVSFP